MVPCDPEHEEVASYDPEEWGDLDPDIASEPYVSSEPKVDPNGMSISMRSS